jgi:heme/copper-type cytochrome/quinol oxidase subunit 3
MHPEDPDWRRGQAHYGADDTQEIRLDKNLIGMAFFIASEAVFFGLLIFAFLYYRGDFFSQSSGTPPNGRVLNPAKTAIFTVALIASSGTLWLAERALRRGSQTLMRLMLLATVVLGAIFLIGQGMEYYRLIHEENVTISRDLFGTTFFTLTGFHGFHVFMGLVALTILFGLALAGWFQERHSVALTAVSWYWHFVDVVWIVIFSIVYLWTRV